MKRWNARPWGMFISELLVAGLVFAALAAYGGARPGASNQSAAGEWKFAVAGDSRDCGDVVMPAIAARVQQQQPAFYWHLGDFRKTSDFDEDMQNELARAGNPLTISAYEDRSWRDFIERQLVPFAPIRIYLGIGNHETTPPKTRTDYLIQFADWLDASDLRDQRLADDPLDHELHAYYHWRFRGVDFLNLDNATLEQFDAEQMAWIQRRLQADAADPEIHTIILGMHKALPDSISKDHSMNESAAGTESGRQVYVELLRLEAAPGKRVYVLASHSHFYMANIFNTEYWRTHGGVLPGWIIGTAGAHRYPLPPNSSQASEARTNVYGYLLARVRSDGETSFAFQQVQEADVPGEVARRYPPQFLDWCFAENTSAR